MTMPHLLALSDRQLGILRERAKVLPHDWRSRFLELVADRLDAHVAAAVEGVLAQMFSGRAA